MKQKKLLICGAIMAVSIIASVSFSLSWFDTRTDLQPNEIYGSSENAYFAYGNGTAAKPYGITNARHLYNLAWLQYMGKFNAKDSSTGKVNQVYFELGGDVDMSTFSTALPPIGTVDNPFVGNFNGNGHTISNLKISSSSSDLTKKPYVVASSFNEPNIIGMFGVVGSIEGTTTNLSYDSSINVITDFELDKATITTNRSDGKALTGIVAGYVNGTISDVQLVEPKLDFKQNTASLINTYSKFTNVSNYSVAGYCEPEYEQTISSTVTTLSNKTSSAVQFTKKEAGDGQGWGGSIDMKEMYTNLKTNWNTFTSDSVNAATKYATASTINYDTDGNEVETVTSTNRVQVSSVNSDYVYTQSSSSYICFYEKEDQNSNDEVTSSYTYVIENPDSPNEYESLYMCLSGYGDRAIKGGKTVTIPAGYRNVDSSQTMFMYQYDSEGTKHYLGYDPNNNNAIVDTTDSTYAVCFYAGSNALSTSFLSGSSYETYYLTNTNGNLSLSTSQTTNWTYDDSASTYKNGNYFLHYNEDEKTWEAEAVDVVYHFSGTSNNRTYYINTSGTSISRSTSATTSWYIDEENYVYMNYNGTNYYITTTSSSGGWGGQSNLTLSTTSTKSSSCFKLYPQSDGTYKMYYQSGSTYYYPTLSSGRNNSNWRASSTSSFSQVGTITTDVISSASYDLETEQGRDMYVYLDTSTETRDSHFVTKDTYFPLKNTNGVPDQKNTGYVVSGSNFYDNAYGDIRVSSFYITDLESYDSSSKTLTSVYTVNDSGTSQNITNSTSYQKYAKSKTALESVLSSDGTYVYGLHFMNASIGLQYSDGHKVRVPKAVINGTEYTNYQLPYDCIDFNLKEKGYINFFAGTYYSGNNSFFSLYQINRDKGNSSNIKSLDKIKTIYSSGNSKDDYVYEYEDGTSSASTSGLTAIFKTSWIEKQSSITERAAYYFEIPVNAGEYALGSVSGANGAYLIYLDIGANAQVVNRTTVTELVQQVRSTYKYAKGIAIINSGTTDTSDSNSYCVLIEDISGGGSTVTYDRTADDATTKLSTAAVTYTNSQTKISCDYKKDTMSLTINNTVATVTPLSTTTKTTKRLTYYDYSVNDGTIEVYQLTKDTDFDKTDETSTGRYYVIDTDGNAGEDQTDYSVYNDEGTVVSDPTTAITIDTDSMTEVYEFLVESPSNSTEKYTITFENMGALSSSVDTNGYYPYVISGYKFTITDSSGNDVTATVTVKKVGESTYTFTINDQDGKTVNTILTITLSGSGS